MKELSEGIVFCAVTLSCIFTFGMMYIIGRIKKSDYLIFISECCSFAAIIIISLIVLYVIFAYLLSLIS